MTVDEAPAEQVDATAESAESPETAESTEQGDSREDGRTRCAWVRGHPDHYFFHDAEWGRLPDDDGPCFERVLLTALSQDRPLAEVLDQRLDLHEALNSWEPEALAGMDDDALDGLSDRGGVFADSAVLRRLRGLAEACVEIGKEFKGLRNYFLVMPAYTAEQQLDDVVARLPGFTKMEAAELVQMVGCVSGSIEPDSHDRDCWIA